jgi:uncharacterized protein (DUF302 family)
MERSSKGQDTVPDKASFFERHRILYVYAYIIQALKIGSMWGTEARLRHLLVYAFNMWWASAPIFKELSMISSKPTEVNFTGVRIRLETSAPPDELLTRLRALTGKASVADIIDICKTSPDEATARSEIESRFVPKSGFMIFAEIDHGAWIGRFGLNRTSVRVILGNPLIAITMIRHDITAGLFAPVDLLVSERQGDRGSTLTYVKPSSLIAINEDAGLRLAAEALDKKLADLIDATLSNLSLAESA